MQYAHGNCNIHRLRVP